MALPSPLTISRPQGDATAPRRIFRDPFSPPRRGRYAPGADLPAWRGGERPTSPLGGEVKARGAQARRAPLIGYRTVGGTTLVEPPDVEPSPALWVALEPPPTVSPLEVVNMASFSKDPFGAVATANTGCAAPRLSNEVDW